MATRERTPVYGMMAEFLDAKELLHAVKEAKEAGYSKLDAYSPYPVEEVSEEIEDHKKSRVGLLVLIGGLTGALAGFGMQYMTMKYGYPMNIGGRPLNSWPAFIPVTFEMTILFASFAAVFGMFILNGLPRPNHPVFNVDRFERASVDRCFLLIKAADPRFDAQETRTFLESLNPQEEVMDVDW